jgi:hypothetical protein
MHAVVSPPLFQLALSSEVAQTLREHLAVLFIIVKTKAI